MNQGVHSEEECDGDIGDSSSDYYYLDDNLRNSPSRLVGDDSRLGHSTPLASPDFSVFHLGFQPVNKITSPSILLAFRTLNLLIYLRF